MHCVIELALDASPGGNEDGVAHVLVQRVRLDPGAFVESSALPLGEIDGRVEERVVADLTNSTHGRAARVRAEEDFEAELAELSRTEREVRLARAR